MCVFGSLLSVARVFFAHLGSPSEPGGTDGWLIRLARRVEVLVAVRVTLLHSSGGNFPVFRHYHVQSSTFLVAVMSTVPETVPSGTVAGFRAF
ncbi:hypothetical protein RvY_07582 [Ramazzottius varieornatus]|uniref:Secreted protein n=1 Tax=Ramazzottius varieornatus TaxID=947166 RepID=A0A1D1V2Y4_RAMVA|nr:hypothetical protein RvY_07582 [Ramazzottius varieornatus]